MQWFARGKLWASREAERDDFQIQKHAASAPREKRADRPEGSAPERRGSEWRPGGKHKDPRDRFKKKNRPERAWSEKDPATQRDRDKPGYKPPVHRSSFDSRGSEGEKPREEWRDKPAGPPRGDRPWQDKPRGDRPWSNKPPGEKRPWSGKPSERSGPPRERKPWNDKAAPPSDRPWQTKPTGPRAQRKPWVGKPGPPGEGAPANRSSFDRKPGDGAGFKPRGDRPWQNKPTGEGKRPWTPKPPDRSGPPRGDRPWTGKPRSDKPGGFNAGGPPRGDRPPAHRSPSDRRPSGSGPDHRSSSDRRPSGGGWSGKPRGDKPGGFSAGGPPRGDRKPWEKKPVRPSGGGFRPSGPPRDGRPREPRKRRDDEPPDKD